MSDQSSDGKVRVRAFQIGVEPDPSGHFLQAVLLPPDGWKAANDSEPVVLATIRRVITNAPGMQDAFNKLLEAIALGMVANMAPDATAPRVEIVNDEREDG